jgi:hypothetical protein
MGVKVTAAALMMTATLGVALFATSPAMASAASANSRLGPPSTTPPVANYTMSCSALGGLIKLPLQVGIFAQAPGSVRHGMTVDLHAVRTQVDIPVSFVNLALAFGLKSLSGDVTTMDFNATNTTSETVNAAATPIHFGPIALVKNQPATLTLPSTPTTVGPWTADSSGTIVYTPGPSSMTVLVPITCAPPAGAQPLAQTVIR